MVLTGIVILVWGINFLKGTELFSRQKEYYAIYTSVDGLSSANPVEINGLKVGQVSSLKLLPGQEGKIIAKLLINNDVRLPKNTIAKIVSSDLLGAKAIRLFLGSDSVYAQSHDTLQTDIQLTLTQEVNKQVAPLKNKAENLLSSLDSVLAVLQYIFNAETRKSLGKSFESIQGTIESLERTTLRLDTLVFSEQKKLKLIFSNIEDISSTIRNNSGEINSIIQNVALISDSLAKSKFVSTVSTINKTFNETSSILEKINKGEGSLGLLINNDSLYKNLTYSADELNKLIEDIRLNPKKYVHYSLISVGGSKNKPAPSQK